MADEEQRAIENADGGEQEEDRAQSEHGGEEAATQPWGMNDLMQYLLRREEQMGRREEQMERERAEMRERLERLVGVVEHSHREDVGSLASAERTTADPLKLTRLTEEDDIEAFLTTFERMMTAYRVDPARWAFKLAPQLTGRAQQAYAALPASEAGDYEQLKKSILRRYDISEETYRQRFRAAKKSEGGCYSEWKSIISKEAFVCVNRDQFTGCFI